MRVTIEYQQRQRMNCQFGISDFSSNAVKPKTPAIKKPNKKPSVSTVTGNEPVGITNQPTTTKTTRAPKSTSKGGKNTNRNPLTTPYNPLTAQGCASCSPERTAERISTGVSRYYRATVSTRRSVGRDG